VPPTTYRWEVVLDRAAEGWWGQLMLAIRSHARGDLEEARLGYLRSAKIRSTPWAARGLAQLAIERGDHAGAADLYASAVAQAPTSLPLLVEATDQLLTTGRSTPCLAMIDAAPDRIPRTAEWSCSGYAPCWPSGVLTPLAPSSKPVSRCPIFGRERR
jgi:hypothetical protein